MTDDRWWTRFRRGAWGMLWGLMLAGVLMAALVGPGLVLGLVGYSLAAEGGLVAGLVVGGLFGFVLFGGAMEAIE